MNDYIWLLPTVHLSEFDDMLVLRRGSDALEFHGSPSRIRRFLDKLDGSTTADDLCVDKVSSQLFEALDNEEWLVRLTRPLDTLVGDHPALSRQLSYYAHLQRRHPDRALDELRNVRVLIIGVGGIGSHVAQSLAGAGVKKLDLSDPDTVDATNLNRQFFYTKHDIGRHKVEAAERFLRARQEDLKIRTVRGNLFASTEGRQVIDAANLVVFCGDGDTVGRAASVLGTKPVLIAGYQGATGQVGPLSAPAMGTRCWSCMVSETGGDRLHEFDERRVRRPTAWNASGSAVNTTLGGLAAEVAIRFLAPSLGGPLMLDSVLRIDMVTLDTQVVALPREQCEHSTTSTNPSLHQRAR